jgi:hypothetical protein
MLKKVAEFLAETLVIAIMLAVVYYEAYKSGKSGMIS